MNFLSMLGLQGISEVKLATRLQLFPVLAAGVGGGELLRGGL